MKQSDINHIKRDLYNKLHEVVSHRIEQYNYLNEVLSSVDSTPYFIDTTHYESVYRKIGIYNKNTRLLNEGKNYPTYITYNQDEQFAIKEMLLITRMQLIAPYLFEDWSEEFSRFLKLGEDAVKKLIKKFTDLIPKNVIEAYNYLGEVFLNGIKSVKRLIQVLGNLFKKLGNTILEGIEKLGLFKDEFVKYIPEDTEISGSATKIIGSKDGNKTKVLSFVIDNVTKGVNNKQLKSQLTVNESHQLFEEDEDVQQASSSVLPVALLAGGGYGLYDAIKMFGSKFSDKVEPYLLSDKSKDIAQKLYDNPVSRIGLGLSIRKGREEDESKLKYFGRICMSILVNLVIAFLISAVISACITVALGTGPLTGLVVACIISGKNIIKIIVNRILNYQKISKGKNGKEKINRFFDLNTIVGLVASTGNVVANIPEVKEAITETSGAMMDYILDKIFGHRTSMSSDAVIDVASKSDDVSQLHGNADVTNHSASNATPSSADAHNAVHQKTGSIAHNMSGSETPSDATTHSNSVVNNHSTDQTANATPDGDAVDKTQNVQQSANNHLILSVGDAKHIPDNINKILHRLAATGKDEVVEGSMHNTTLSSVDVNGVAHDEDMMSAVFSNSGTSGLPDGDNMRTYKFISDNLISSKCTDGDVIESDFIATYLIPDDVDIKEIKEIEFGIYNIIENGDTMFDGSIDISGTIIKCTDKSMIGKNISELINYVKNT